MHPNLRALLRHADRSLAALSLRVVGERTGLVSIVLHGLVESQHDYERDDVDPFHRFTVANLRSLLQHFAEAGWTFLSLADLQSDIDPHGRYVLLTFDDGYANNQLALPVLRELGVPATLFVATRPIEEQRCFWWDIVYRERRRRGVSREAIGREQDALKRRTSEQIRAYVDRELGRDATLPRGDIDRPLTVAELRQIASDPLITIGNHTADHAILTVESEEDIKHQIATCQQFLERTLGASPSAIAYPNGDTNPRVESIAASCGLRFGFTVASTVRQLPLNPTVRMRVPRAYIEGGANLTGECVRLRGPWSLRRMLERS